MKRIVVISVLLFFSLMAVTVIAADTKLLQPDKKVKCPVCGMFVYKYPDWVAEIIFKDGTSVFFDGGKDLFKYFFNMKKYEKVKTQQDITAIFVTEYYDMQMIDAEHAFLSSAAASTVRWAESLSHVKPGRMPSSSERTTAVP